MEAFHPRATNWRSFQPSDLVAAVHSIDPRWRSLREVAQLQERCRFCRWMRCVRGIASRDIYARERALIAQLSGAFHFRSCITNSLSVWIRRVYERAERAAMCRSAGKSGQTRSSCLRGIRIMEKRSSHI